MIFHRTSEKNLVRCFSSLQIPNGSVVCIHAMLSGLGYLVGGPQAVIRGMLNAIPDVTLMMPSFPFSGTMDVYLNSNPLFDPQSTPSASGLLSELLRCYPGSFRSLHPTHPCVALGPEADQLLHASEKSITPFGADSPYGRFSKLNNAVLLLIHTNNTSLVHRIQEMVETPNLFLSGSLEARGYDSKRNIAQYQVRVHRPIIPLYVPMGAPNSPDIEYIWLPDYVLLFPEYNRERILGRLKNSQTKEFLLDREQFFKANGITRTTRIKQAEIMAIDVQPWLKRICTDLEENIKEFSRFYQLSEMTNAMKNGKLTKF